MIDVASVRADTPGCERQIHFNNAGAALMPAPVYDAVVAHLRLERDIGGYEAAEQQCEQIEAFYSEFAGMLAAKPHEIAYVENATRAWDMAFYGLPLKTGDRILTHESEYVSNYLALLQRARSRGLEIDVVPSDSLGQIDLQAMEELIGPRTRLVMLTHVPTQGGLVNPAEAVGKIAARHGLIYMLDACQSAGQMELNVSRIGCHVLSGTGRKFLRGPRGTGFLYVCDDMIAKIEPPFIDLRSAEWTTSNTYKLVPDATRFENWESFVAGRIGLAHAVQYARRIGLDDIEESILRLARQLRDGLSALPKVTVHDRGKRQCGIVTFLKDGLAPYDMQQRLRDAGINVSVSTRNSAQLDFGSRGLNSLVRASVHYYNTENEVDRFVETIRKLQ